METLEALRKRQAQRIKNTCTLHATHFADADVSDCNGQPYYVGSAVEVELEGVA